MHKIKFREIQKGSNILKYNYQNIKALMCDMSIYELVSSFLHRMWGELSCL